eukprot:gnl/TRDRNA2_/TRDRNA2_60934_c0_seq1.p1 gnl/TRDRNA2_/TRDRNA2_60934_c0~~gnl/TRDRNA2_/TRDRNA2_60934_c0_seq1.p1  ORF type:complete len:273 (-),score=21.54 gnl/TRDRNA2_/TRDRNA2_60934_c0_seq1:241-1059(-)
MMFLAENEDTDRTCELLTTSPAITSPPAGLVKELVLDYDAMKFPFTPAVLAVIEEPPGTDLSCLHLTDHGKLVVQRCQSPVGPADNPWKRRFASCEERDPIAFSRFIGIYHGFLRSIVLPHLETRCLAFERVPLFRCHLPGCGAPGMPHRDADSDHPACEINFWLPVTPAFGTNSVFAESARGAGDFHAFEVSGEGKVVRFYGNQVWHYGLPNDTDSTRVSFDFRVIRIEEWTPEAFQHFRLGEHFSVMDSDVGVLPLGSPQLSKLIAEYTL